MCSTSYALVFLEVVVHAQNVLLTVWWIPWQHVIWAEPFTDPHNMARTDATIHIVWADLLLHLMGRVAGSQGVGTQGGLLHLMFWRSHAGWFALRIWRFQIHTNFAVTWRHAVLTSNLFNRHQAHAIRQNCIQRFHVHTQLISKLSDQTQGNSNFSN